MPTTVQRIFNFSAGPAVLPQPVLEEAQRDLVSLPGVGMSILEISHRSKAFESILHTAEADIRALAGIPDDYAVLFLQGGASLQFSMVPMNLLPEGGSADYVVTGAWSQKAVKEAKRHGKVNIAATTEAGNFVRVPDASEIVWDAHAAYAHVTSNNTIFGTQFQTMPESGPSSTAGGPPLVCDASSDIFSRPIDVAKYGLIYAGAQKNLGPSGVTLVIMRKELLARAPKSLPTMLNYATHAENDSMYNTPPCFGIYILGLVAKWLKGLGGLGAIQTINERKAAKVYAEIDRSGFYRGHAEPGSRSRMNVTFRLPSEALEGEFAKASTAAGLDGLKGHRSVGGLRASIYNAFPEEGVDALVSFMQEFERTRG
jgi:phosphoserine aminotransferase